MSWESDKQTVTYNGLLMQRVDNTLLCNDDGAIIDWLSSYDYPRELLTRSGTNTVILHRQGELDLVMVTNDLLTDGQRLAVRIRLNFVGQRLDLRKLDRPYTDANKTHYEAVWAHIDLQLLRLTIYYNLPPISFWTMDQGQTKPHYRYV